MRGRLGTTWKPQSHRERAPRASTMWFQRARVPTTARLTATPISPRQPFSKNENTTLEDVCKHLEFVHTQLAKFSTCLRRKRVGVSWYSMDRSRSVRMTSWNLEPFPSFWTPVIVMGLDVLLFSFLYSELPLCNVISFSLAIVWIILADDQWSVTSSLRLLLSTK